MQQNILVKVGADISDLSAALQRAGSQVAGFARDTEAGFQAVGTLGKTITAGGVALAGGLGYAVKTAADFEKSMSRVGALSGATEKEMQQLTDTALEMGRTTSFTAGQSADALSFLAMA